MDRFLKPPVLQMNVRSVTGAQNKITFKATSHSTIFDIPMRPMREDQRHRRRFTR